MLEKYKSKTYYFKGRRDNGKILAVGGMED